MCAVLAAALPRVPNSTLRAKFVGCTKVLMAAMERFPEHAAAYKGALGCLCQVRAGAQHVSSSVVVL